jgi:hypothetical protein
MRNPILLAVFLVLPAGAIPQTSSAQQSAPKTTPSTAAKPAAPANGAMTNRDVIALVKARVSDDVIISKIKRSKTQFDTSTQGLVTLKYAGVSDRLIGVMVDPEDAGEAAPAAAAAPATRSNAGTTTARSAAPKSAPPAPKQPPLRPGEKPSNAAGEAVATSAGTTRRTAAEPPPPPVTVAPANYGMYIQNTGELKPLGVIETKIQVSKFRSLLKTAIPFVRQKIDIDIPGAHATSRFQATRPVFYAYFPPSRDVSKFKLLQCKITGQNFDQRTVANASIMFSTEQNQDEVPLDIGPTSVKDLYRLSPREDLPGGEFGFVEGNTGSKSASNIDILDVYDFGIDRPEEKLSVPDYLDTLPPARLPDEDFLSWTKEFAQKIVDDHEGKIGIAGSMMGWFKRQFASLDVYWVDPQFARAFARMEMLDRSLSAAQTAKLASLLLSPTNDQYYVMVSIGGKIGSGHLIGANEGERLMRPFDASLSANKSKDVVPAQKLEFIGGYADLWKITFSEQSIKGPLLNGGTDELVFEARLNQNLDFKSTFDVNKIMPPNGAAPQQASTAPVTPATGAPPSGRF